MKYSEDILKVLRGTWCLLRETSCKL